MRSMRNKKARRVLRLPDLDYAKRAILNRLGSRRVKAGISIRLDDFVGCFNDPRLRPNRHFQLSVRVPGKGGPVLLAFWSMLAKASVTPSFYTCSKAMTGIYCLAMTSPADPVTQLLRKWGEG